MNIRGRESNGKELGEWALGMLAEDSPAAIEQEESSRVFGDKGRDPFELLGGEQGTGKLPENQKIKGMQRSLCGGKGRWGVWTGGRGVLVGRPKDGEDFPLGIAFKEVAQVARLPAGSSIDEEQLASAVGHPDLEGGVIVAVFALGGEGLDGNGKGNGGGTECGVGGALGGREQIFYGEIEGNLAQGGAEGGEGLFPDDPFAGADLSDEGESLRGALGEGEGSAQAVLAEDALGGVDGEEGKVDGGGGLADPDREDGSALFTQSPCGGHGIWSGVVASVREEEDGGVGLGGLEEGEQGGGEVGGGGLGGGKGGGEFVEAIGGEPDRCGLGIVQREEFEFESGGEPGDGALLGSGEEDLAESLEAWSGVESLEGGARLGLV
ncbi:MAG: hypothetical protein RLZZ142_1484 [Verrucomicrobiota bacterium]